MLTYKKFILDMKLFFYRKVEHLLGYINIFRFIKIALKKKKEVVTQCFF